MFIRNFINRNICRRGLVLFCFLITFNCFSKPVFDQNWINLLHIEKNNTLIDTPEFFLTPVEKLNPKAELEASLKAINSDQKFGKMKLSFPCAYPARYKYLANKYHVKTALKCSELEEWLKGLNAESISLVFASYYPNNPASIFGHTFLKINTSSKNLISDYAINYLAITSESNGLIFGLKGLFGQYRGQLSVLPYFMKVNEYNHSESRDIFEYHLNLSIDEVDTLLRHVWELENNGAFDYYFLDDNCSYFLMRLLDVARPTLKLAKEFPSFVIPAETIKAVYRKGIITQIDYRPSLYTILGHEIKKKGPNDIDNQILIHQFKKQTQKHSGKEFEDRYHKLLVARSKMPRREEANDVKPSSYPHETHSPVAWGIGTGILNEKNFTKLTIRPGVHSILDSSAGYLPNSSIELLKTSFRFFRSSQFYLDQFTLIDVQTLNPHKSWDSKLSWKSKIEYLRFDQDICQGCEVERFYSGIGKTIEFGKKNLLSFFLDGQVLLSKSTPKKFSYGVSPALAHYYFGNWINFETSATLLNRFDQNKTIDSLKMGHALSYHLNKSHQLRLKAQYYAPVSDKAESRSEGLLEWFVFHD